LGNNMFVRFAQKFETQGWLFVLTE